MKEIACAEWAKVAAKIAEDLSTTACALMTHLSRNVAAEAAKVVDYTTVSA